MTPDEIKKSVDLVEYIRSQGIQLKKKGQYDLVGLCPFHNDTKPSLIVTRSKAGVARNPNDRWMVRW